MRAIVRKQSRKSNDIPLNVLKRTSNEADRELAHLSKIVETLIELDKGSSPLGPAYWMARLRELRVGYALLSTQRAQIAALDTVLRNSLKETFGMSRDPSDALPETLRTAMHQRARPACSSAMRRAIWAGSWRPHSATPNELRHRLSRRSPPDTQMTSCSATENGGLFSTSTRRSSGRRGRCLASSCYAYCHRKVLTTCW
ncbi:hypothetical protein AWB74_07769 [Caballeronia arvi]|uniref:Uncharacterized protein n=1 Tax=Caballeronia arvi TaxID=1777135 RepID=A0A158L179_9BURK|nr:hypothetical protein AWB74_07769 [Caballeronia arvi]